MVTYIIRRLLWSVLLLFVVSFITFVMFILLPSADPALLRAGRQPTPELIAAIRENLGSTSPGTSSTRLHADLVLHFDFGYSYQNNIAVRETIFDRLPATASLAIGAAVTWLLIGIPIGIISAIKRGTLLDRAAMGFALMAISAPVYWVGLVSIYLFSEDLGKLAPIFQGSGQYTPFTENPVAVGVGAAPAVARPRDRVRGDLRPLPAREPARRDGRGLHPHRAGQGPRRAPRGLQARAALGDHPDRHHLRPRPRHPVGRRDPHGDRLQHPGIGRLAFDAIQKSDLPIVQGTVLIAAAPSSWPTWSWTSCTRSSTRASATMG